MSKKKRKKKSRCNDVVVWTEKQHDEYVKGIYGMDVIAGFTENGVPYGTYVDENDKHDILISQNSSFDSIDEV